MLDFISDATEQKRSPGLASFTWFTIVWTLIVVLGTVALVIVMSTDDEESTANLIAIGLVFPGVFCLPLWVVQYIWYRKVRFAHDFAAYGPPTPYNPYYRNIPSQQAYSGIPPPDPIPGGRNTLVEKNALEFGYTQNLSFRLKAFSVFTLGWTIVWGVIWALALIFTPPEDSNAGILIFVWLFIMLMFCGPFLVGQYLWQNKWKQRLLMGPMIPPGYPYHTGYQNTGQPGAGYPPPVPPAHHHNPGPAPPQAPAPPGYTPVKNPHAQGYAQGYMMGPAQHPPQAYPPHPAPNRPPPPPRGQVPGHTRNPESPRSHPQATHGHGHIPTVQVNRSAGEGTMADDEAEAEEGWEVEGLDDEVSTGPNGTIEIGYGEADSDEQDLLISKARELEDAGDHLGAIKLYEECGLWEEVDRLVMKDYQTSSEEERG